MSMYQGGPYPPPPPQPYAGYPGAPGYLPTVVAPQNGIGVAALAVGVVALLSSWTIIGGLALGALAVIFGLVGYSKAKKGLANNGAMALVGVALGVVSAVIAVAIIAFLASIANDLGFSEYMDCTVKANNDPIAVEVCRQQFESRVNGYFGVK